MRAGGVPLTREVRRQSATRRLAPTIPPSQAGTVKGLPIQASLGRPGTAITYRGGQRDPSHLLDHDCDVMPTVSPFTGPALGLGALASPIAQRLVAAPTARISSRMGDWARRRGPAAMLAVTCATRSHAAAACIGMGYDLVPRWSRRLYAIWPRLDTTSELTKDLAWQLPLLNG